MRRTLIRHPDSPCDAVARIEVEATRPAPGVLALRYLVAGAVADLVLPPHAPSARTDELWRHTCFEAFVRAPDGDAYMELNLAPSTQWAAYRFDGYRQGMAPADIETPRFEVHSTPEAFELAVALELPGWPPTPWRLGLSTVIEEAGGRISYWALVHPPGRADFHHADGFDLELPASERP